jgi:hypothetical protein
MNVKSGYDVWFCYSLLGMNLWCSYSSLNSVSLASSLIFLLFHCEDVINISCVVNSVSLFHGVFKCSKCENNALFLK